MTHFHLFSGPTPTDADRRLTSSNFYNTQEIRFIFFFIVVNPFEFEDRFYFWKRRKRNFRSFVVVGFLRSWRGRSIRKKRVVCDKRKYGTNVFFATIKCDQFKRKGAILFCSIEIASLSNFVASVHTKKQTFVWTLSLSLRPRVWWIFIEGENVLSYIIGRNIVEWPECNG